MESLTKSTGKAKRTATSKPVVVSETSTEGNSRVNEDLVVDELKELYFETLLPIEKKCLFGKFHGPEISASELSAKPAVLLLGQYSTGKTTFIKSLIGMDYPDMNIGPEPTTDRFIAVVHGDNPKIIRGNAFTGVTDLPFTGLNIYGSAFLDHFSAAICPSELLKEVTIIDTPGVLAADNQNSARGYDFPKVCRWFAERSGRSFSVGLLFVDTLCNSFVFRRFDPFDV